MLISSINLISVLGPVTSSIDHLFLEKDWRSHCVTFQTEKIVLVWKAFGNAVLSKEMQETTEGTISAVSLPRHMKRNGNAFAKFLSFILLRICQFLRKAHMQRWGKKRYRDSRQSSPQRLSHLFPQEQPVSPQTLEITHRCESVQAVSLASLSQPFWHWKKKTSLTLLDISKMDHLECLGNVTMLNILLELFSQ